MVALAALTAGLALSACKGEPAEITPTTGIDQPTATLGADGIRPETPLSTLPSPLSGVEFPTQPVEYPPDWPAQLIFPAEFILVQASSGSIEADSPTGWSASLRYPLSAGEAVKQLTLFFTGSGWAVQANPMASGATLLLLEKNDSAGQGLLVVAADAQAATQANILATIFP